jgi:hypothetical protein
MRSRSEPCAFAGCGRLAKSSSATPLCWTHYKHKRAGVPLRPIGTPSRLLDLTGKTFGRWTVLRRGPNGGGPHRARWECVCACGTTATLKRQVLVSGNSKSCGCYKRDRLTSKRHGPGEHGFGRYLSAYKADARRRGHAFALTDAEVRTLATGQCHYCGVPPFRRRMGTLRGAHGTTITTLEHGAFICNGIDRIDSKIGYVRGNVVSCCRDCNIAKSTLSSKAFLALVLRIYNWSLRSAVQENVPEKDAAVTDLRRA